MCENNLRRENTEMSSLKKRKNRLKFRFASKRKLLKRSEAKNLKRKEAKRSEKREVKFYGEIVKHI